MRRFTDLLKRFRRDESGAFLVLFAVLALVLIATSGAVVDFTYMQTARSRAQTALDSAALALQAHINDVGAQATITTQAQKILQERLADSRITATITGVTIDTAAGRLNLKAQITVPTAFVQLVGIKNISARLTSEALRGSSDLEVSVALDITGSMATTTDKYGNVTSDKIGDLIKATNSLIDLVVNTSQTPTYSKMAIVPWSFGANLGSWATQVRGTPVTLARTITGATWASGSGISIKTVTRGSPVTIETTANHGLSTGNQVFVSFSTTSNGMSALDEQPYTITKTSNTKFTLNGTSPNSGSASGGTVTKCLYQDCDVRVSGTGIGASPLKDGDGAYITNVGGFQTLVDTGYFIDVIDNSTIELLKSNAGGGGVYNKSGTLTRANYGDIYFHFVAEDGSEQTFQPNNCTSERATHTYDDAAPTTTLLAFNYTSGGANCVAQVIQPLTPNKTTLHALTNSLTATGSTSGHLGLAWGWYMLAPNFAYLWPSASQPAAYKKNNLVKAIILMTDGAFNSPYCSGVIAADAGSGSGGDGSHNSCNSPNGSSQSQAQSICNAIKAASNGITLYTVGFDLGTDANALSFLQGCATDLTTFFRADTGADLSTAFKKIAQNLSDLRLSK